MVTPSAKGNAGQSPSDSIRDASRLVFEHPIPLYDPAWLKKLHYRCLWDGCRLTGGSDFCSTRCAERYAEWEYRTVHVLVGREPLHTFIEQGRDPATMA